MEQNTYSLPTATTTVLGGVKIDGTTITINNGVISSDWSCSYNYYSCKMKSTDTTCFPLFTTNPTGNLAPKTSTGLKLNSSSGQLEAGSFKKTGGTSSEFLKADGSIDSSTYSTVTSINGLSDVTISGASNGEVLKYNGTAWVNGNDNTGGGSSSIDLSLSVNKPSIYPVKIPDVKWWNNYSPIFLWMVWRCISF